MYSNNPEDLAAKAKAMIDGARQRHALVQQQAIELQALMDSLATTSLGSDLSTNTAAAVLFLVGEMLSDMSIHQLYECGIRTAARGLRNARAASDQQDEQASAYSTQVTDICLSKLVDSYESISRCLEKSSGSAANASAANAADLLHLALVCTENIHGCLEHMSNGNGDIRASPKIWTSNLDGVNPVALYLIRLFESTCRIFTASTAQALIRQSQYKAQCSALYKASGVLIELLSSVFSSSNHLSQDLGMKRSILERYCEHALSVYKAFMSFPQQFKAVWKTLCRIVTIFTAASFNSAGLCTMVYSQSCGTVQTLASQTASLLRRTSVADMSDDKLLKRTRSSLAFIRFFVFQMASLLARIRSSINTSSSHTEDTGVVASTMSMLDVIFGELMDPSTLAHVSPDISSVARQTVSTVAEKLAVSLFVEDISPALSYLDMLDSFVAGADRTKARISHMPLMDGIKSASANREILRIIIANIGTFSPDQQQQFLDHGMSIMSAFALAIDCDPSSVFPVTKGDTFVYDGQQTSTIEYEQLVSSVSLSGACLSSAGLFCMWELAVFAIVLQSPPGSLGAKIIVDGWLALAKHLLPHSALISSMNGIVDVAVSTTEPIAEVVYSRLCRILGGFLSVCDGDEQTKFIADLSTKYSTRGGIANFARVCSLVPWGINCTPAFDVLFSQAMEQLVSGLNRSNLSKDGLHIFSGLCAMVPRIKRSKLRCDKVEEIHGCCRAALTHCLDEKAADASTLNMLDKAMSLSILLAGDNMEFAASVLELCVNHISNPVFNNAKAGTLLASLAGCFVSADFEQPPFLTTAPLLQHLFVRLTSEDMPWIVRHEAHVQLIRFATESENTAMTEALVPETTQASLLSFIQHEPAGSGIMPGDQISRVYKRCFDTLVTGYSDSLMALDACDESNILRNGTGSASALLEAISMLRKELLTACSDGTKQMPVQDTHVEELGKRGVDDEAIIEYCVGLLGDETMDSDEKKDAIAGYLEAVIEEDLGEAIDKALALVDEEKTRRTIEDQTKAKEALDRALEKEKEELERDAKETKEAAGSATRQLTAEERKQRERFLMTYGFHVDEIVEGQNGEDEIVYKEKDQGRADMAGVQRNVNAQVVAEKEKALRESNRAAHQKKVEREKELVERERLRKEKEKRRTMKKEKRRM
ncbi:hypothetical protein GGI12_000229 [Dipsacomyces acuminosporus]|nr:hypothetical protein GGI12_000229 [Dipsacomyces acuminosporus]